MISNVDRYDNLVLNLFTDLTKLISKLCLKTLSHGFLNRLDIMVFKVCDTIHDFLLP